MTDPVVTSRRAVEHGWLRRPEMDGKKYDAWELPNGAMIAVEKGVDPVVLKIEVPSLRDLMTKLGRSDA